MIITMYMLSHNVAYLMKIVSCIKIIKKKKDAVIQLIPSNDMRHKISNDKSDDDYL